MVAAFPALVEGVAGARGDDAVSPDGRLVDGAGGGRVCGGDRGSAEALRDPRGADGRARVEAALSTDVVRCGNVWNFGDGVRRVDGAKRRADGGGGVCEVGR